MTDETLTPIPNVSTINYKEIAVDIAAIGILAVGAYQSIMNIPMPDFFLTAFGSAIAYLFIKNSPNTV